MKPVWLNTKPRERVLLLSGGEIDDVLASIRNESMAGYCLACGEEAGPVEPDATGYHCDSCGKATVCGAEQLLLMGRFVELDSTGKARRLGY